MTSVEVATMPAGEGLDFFSSLMSDMKTMNDEKLTLMSETLPSENKKVAENQSANAEAFFEELRKEAKEVNEYVKNFRDKIIKHHSQGPSKSYLKAPLRVYEASLPPLDLEALERTFEIDVDTCKSIAKRVETGREMVVANYPKFMA